LIMTPFRFAVTCFATVAPAAAYEWAGIFQTPQDEYMWTAQKVDGKYADPAMNLVVLPASKSTATELDSLKAEGERLVNKNMSDCTSVTFGSEITPQIDTCYSLKFDQSLWQTLYKMNTKGVAAVAFFAEHVPTEFENTAHYLKDSSGEDIEPDAELPLPPAEKKVEDEKAKPWGPAIGAAIITNVITFSGVVLLVPGITRLQSMYPAAFTGVISGFAAGALLSCAFFLLLFEATHLVAAGWKKEVDILWRWGTMILAGFILPTIIHSVAGLVVPTEKSSKDQQDASNGVAEEAGVEQVSIEVAAPLDTLTRYRLIGGVLIGDFFHNLCDGFFVGAAFSGCGDNFGWKVALATFLHEIPQELADFAILISPEVGLGRMKALAANFISGMGVLLGALIIIAAEVSDSDTGLLLAFGGGVYLHVAATECMPKIYNKDLTPVQNLVCLGAFIVGAVLIGLILLDHEHCVPAAPEGEASSGGHGH
jgi:zinc transporter ZupT